MVLRHPRETVFSTKEFVLDFDTLNYRDVCFQCQYDVYSFDEEPCSKCMILRPSRFHKRRRKVRKIKGDD